MKTLKTLFVIAICLFASVKTFAFADGDLDLTFGTGGKTFTPFSPHRPLPGSSDIAVQPDGKIVVISGALAEFLEGAMILARYNPNGTLDTTFGSGGKVTAFNSFGEHKHNSVLIEPTGNILVAGSSSRLTGPPDRWLFNLVIARFAPNGAQLGGFEGLPNGVGGLPVNDIALTTGNKVITVAAGGSNSYLFRHNTSGSLDTTFDGDGIANYNMTEVNAVASQTDGKVLVAGKLGSDWAVRRFNTDGSPDTTFDGDGLFNAPVGTGASAAKEMIVNPDGKIITVGVALNPGDVTALVQLNPDGSLDNTFDGDGMVFTAVPSTTGGADLELQRDGKIVAFSSGTGDIFGLSRYLPNGALDTTFSGDGIATEAVAAKPGAIALQPDGKIVASGNTMLSAFFGDSFAVARFTATAPPGVPTSFDYDGDGKSDISVFRPSNGQWWLNKSSAGLQVFQFGASSDKLAPGDYTGDGKTDVAFWRPGTGEWFILRSEDSSYFSFYFGSSTDIPAPGDFDGDSIADAAVFRPSTGTWFIQKSTGGTSIFAFGTAGDVPVAADFDGDGKADAAIYRPSTGQWWLNQSSGGVVVYTFGTSTDKVVPGDYTGDGKADVAFWRPSSGEWFILRSEDSSYYSFPFGANGDLPVPGDYDGDGIFDTAVFRPSGSTWYVQRTTAGLLVAGFGINGDQPVPNVFVP